MNDGENDDLEFAMAFQDVVLPARVPVLPLLDLGARFTFADGAREPVGNWVDVVTLADGGVALVIGEAPGTGIAAAAVMGQVSAVVRAGLCQSGDAAQALALADTYAAATLDARGTTLTIVVIDAGAATVSYATAGHPAPFVASASGAWEQLAATGGGPLGVSTGTSVAVEHRPLRPGDIVALSCAAALHRGRALEVLSAVGAGDDLADDLDRAAAALFEEMACEETLTLVAARRRTEAHDDLLAVLPNDAATIGQARNLLRDWLERLAASAMDEMALLHAAGELVTNAVEHGDAGAEHDIELRATLSAAGTARVEVRNDGTWQPRADDLEGGRGLAMAAGLVDRFSIALDESGTHAVLEHRLSRPVAIDSGAPTTATPRVPVVITSAPEVISLHGTFGPDDVDRVAAQVAVATQGGTSPLTLDLSTLTRLSTSAMGLLADLTSTTQSNGTPTSGVRIRATRDSAVQRALDSALIPHDAD